MYSLNRFAECYRKEQSNNFQLSLFAEQVGLPQHYPWVWAKIQGS